MLRRLVGLFTYLEVNAMTLYGTQIKQRFMMLYPINGLILDHYLLRAPVLQFQSENLYSYYCMANAF